MSQRFYYVTKEHHRHLQCLRIYVTRCVIHLSQNKTFHGNFFFFSAEVSNNISSMQTLHEAVISLTKQT
jgi:hypothetical protein